MASGIRPGLARSPAHATQSPGAKERQDERRPEGGRSRSEGARNGPEGTGSGPGRGGERTEDGACMTHGPCPPPLPPPPRRAGARARVAGEGRGEIAFLPLPLGEGRGEGAFPDLHRTDGLGGHEPGGPVVGRWWFRLRSSMGKGQAIGKLLNALAPLSVEAGVATAATMGGAVIGGTLALPVIAVGAVALLGVAGWSVYRDLKTGEKLDKIDSVETWLTEVVRRMGVKDASFAEVLRFAKDNDLDARDALPKGLDALPDGVDQDAMAKLLAIIQAEGEEREKLILEQTTMVELLNGYVHAHFAEIKDRFDLQDTDLAIIRRDIRKTNSTVDVIEWILLDREAPPLRLPNRPLNESTRFIYSARRVEMRGREAEMDELAGFLECDEKFKWSAWTGLAGMGKSRLALEFCDRAAEMGWEVGFYEWRVKRKPAWDKWHPDLPTLIVFDYVQEHAKEIGAAIGLLASQAAGLGRKVRFLLLERPVPDKSGFSAGSWWETLLDKGHETNAAAIASSCHDHEGDAPTGVARLSEPCVFARASEPRPRELGGLAPEAVKDILAELAAMLERHPHPPSPARGCKALPEGEGGRHLSDAELDRQLAQLERVSRDCRPLYVALLAEALEAGAMRPDWTAIDLTKFVLEKEQRRWEAALKAAKIEGNDQEPWINLFLLATMCGGLVIPEGQKGIFGDETLDDWLPTRKQHGTGTTLARFAHGATGRNLPRLEPDMLGELFVLEAMQGWEPRDTDFRSAAWRHDPKGFGEFLVRAVNSFPKHPTLEKLLETPTDTAALPSWDQWRLIVPLGLRVNCLRDLGDKKNTFCNVVKMHQMLSAYVHDNPSNDSARDLCFMGPFFTYDKQSNDTAYADKVLAALTNLTVNDSEERDLCEILAKGYGAALHRAAAAGDAARAADMAEALVPLREAVCSQPDMMPLFKQAFEAAIDLAIEQDNAEAGAPSHGSESRATGARQRLIAASKALFGG